MTVNPEVQSGATSPAGSESKRGASVPARGAIHLLIARLTLMGIGMAISVILGRGLATAAYGDYEVLLSVLVWLEMAACAGIPSATGKLLHDGRHAPEAVERASKGLMLGIGVLLFAVSWALAPAVARWLDVEGGARLFRLAVLDLPVSGLYYAYQGQLNGRRQFGTLGVAFVVYALTKLIGILVLVALGLTIAGALVVNVLATVGVLGFLVAVRPPRGPRPSGALRGELLRIGLPIGLFLLAFQLLSNLDLWLLNGMWQGAEGETGVYAVSYKLSSMLTVVPAVMAGVLFASLAFALGQGNESLARHHVQAASRFALVVLAPACALIAIYGEEVIALVYSDKYAGGGTYLTARACAVSLAAFFDLFCQAQLVSGRQKRTALLLVALVPVSIGLSLLWIPSHGGLGAASAMLATVALGTVIAGVLTYRSFGGLLRLPTLARVLGATALTAAVAWFVPLAGWWLVPGVPALLGLYVLALALLRELTPADLGAVAVWRR